MNGSSLNRIKSAVTAGLAILVSSVFLGCPGGYSSTGGSAPVSTYAKGSISAKGSIFVNGIEYETTSGTITLDNVSGGDTDLKVGMYVEVKGTVDPDTGKGTADEVNYSSSIEGTIDTGSLDAATGAFSVFALAIQTDAATVYENSTGFAGTSPLAEGDRVEVSGILDSATSTIKATRVEKKSLLDDFKVKGTVSALAAGSFTLTLESGAAFTVNYTGTLDSAIVDGSRVKIEFTAAPSSGTISAAADKIELKHRLTADEGDRVEASGIVSAFDGGADPVTFNVDDIAVSAAASLASGVADGVKVEVKGDMQGSVLVATSIEVEQDADMEIKGVVTAVDAAAGTIAVNGVTLNADAKTIFRDDSDTPVIYFGLGDFSAGNILEAKIYEDSNGDYYAVKIERKNASETEAEMSGIVSAVNGDSITILGVPVDTTTLTWSAPSDRTAFLAAITAGSTKVKLSGTVSGSAVTWSVAEIDG